MTTVRTRLAAFGMLALGVGLGYHFRPHPIEPIVTEPAPALADRCDRKMSVVAVPFYDDAQARLNHNDFLGARSSLRDANLLNPRNCDIQESLDLADRECVTWANRELMEAKVYRSADAFSDARHAIELAFTYADDPDNALYEKASAAARAELRELNRVDPRHGKLAGR